MSGGMPAGGLIFELPANQQADAGYVPSAAFLFPTRDERKADPFRGPPSRAWTPP